MSEPRQAQNGENVVTVCMRAFGLRYRTQLAKLLGVTKFAVRNWEDDDRLPPARAIQLTQLARAEGVVLPREFYDSTGLPAIENGEDKAA